MYDGDLQKWKRYANTLRLRLALRAHGAPGADFADVAVTASLGAPLMESANDIAKIERDRIIDKWGSSGYNTVWWDFSWTNAARWKLSKSLVDMLRNNEDPRLFKIARPLEGGDITFTLPKDATEKADLLKRLTYIRNVLDEAGVTHTYKEESEGTGEEQKDVATISIEKDKFYAGQPSRFNNKIQPVVRFEFFSSPSEYVVADKQDLNAAGDLMPALAMTTAEAYFLRAEAILKGIGSGSAEDMYRKGIEASMMQWGVDEADITTFLAKPIASLSGNTTENLEKVYSQRWLADFGLGFEAWAVMRDTGYPMSATANVPEDEYHDKGTVGVGIPFRMRYPSSEATLNGSNMDAAIARQGENVQATKLWWAK